MSEDWVSTAAEEELEAVEVEFMLDTELRSAAVLVVTEGITDVDCDEDCCCAWTSLI